MELFDQDNDISDEEMIANGDFLVGWTVHNRFKLYKGTPRKEDIEYTYDNHKKFIAIGFATATEFYKAIDLDSPSPSSDWWAAFNAAE